MSYLKNFHLEGIEPDKEESKALMKQKKFPYKKIYTDAIYHKETKMNLFITNELGCTSIYEPNTDELKPYLASDFVVKKKIRINVKPLDLVIPEEKIFDFINIDVQGAEWDVIQGGKRFFKNIMGIALESHFFEFYKNEKLFPEVNSLLKKDYRLLDLKLRLMGGEIGEIGNAVYIKKHNLIKNKEDLIKRILFCTLFDRKEHIEFLLRNYGDLLSFKEKLRIEKIFKIDLKHLERTKTFFDGKWNSYYATQDFLDGNGYLEENEIKKI